MFLCKRFIGLQYTIPTTSKKKPPSSLFQYSGYCTSSLNPHNITTPPQSTQDVPTTTETTTHFGYQTVPTGEKEGLVGDVFQKVAGKYDVMNDVMSFGVHRVWKDAFVKTLNPLPGAHILDVAAGTGDIAFRCIENIRNSRIYFPRPSTTPITPQNSKIFSPPSTVTVCDINPSMLQVGKDRAHQRGYSNLQDPRLQWVEANAENLPFDDNSIDAYTIAFGIRNCTNITAVLDEAYRVLRVGGRFMCLEFGQVDVPVLQQIYDFYSFNFIPVWGKLISNDYESYQYPNCAHFNFKNEHIQRKSRTTT